MKTTRLIPSLLIATLLLTPPLHAQQRRRQGRNNEGVALPERVAPGAPKPAQPPVQRTGDTPKPADIPGLPVKDEANAEAASPAPAKDEAVGTKEPPTPVKGGILLNFQGASLTDVLNYLSEAAGFIIVQDAPVTGTVNVVSKQPVSADEAVDLLNTVLAEKGYTAIRSERILKIVSRKDAQKKDLPVRMGSDPDKIPRKDEMVTQILPLRFGEAAKLIENLRPLLPDNATMSANDSSNSIIMTDTLTNIRRIAQIIRAIDTSVASISTIHIYPLEYADAKELATLVTQLFSPASASNQGGRGGRGGGGPGGFFGGMFGGQGGPGGGGAPAAPQSEAKQAESRVVAVADEQSNSLVVSASDELIPLITDVVIKLDTSGTDVSETRIFRLLHADATELATIITTLYGDSTTQRGQNGQNNPFGGRGGFPFGPQPQQNSSAQKSSRALQQSKVTAVGDPRTNSLLISAARETIMSIAELVGRLDASDSKKQKVYYHSLTHADADNVANVLRGMLGDQNAISNTSQSAGSRLTNRSANGAAMDTTEFSGANSGRGGGGGGR